MSKIRETVFLLTHEHVDADLFAGRSDSEIGVFTSRAKAEDALKRHAILPGFKDSPENLKIHTIKLDALLDTPIEIWE